MRRHRFRATAVLAGRGAVMRVESTRQQCTYYPDTTYQRREPRKADGARTYPMMDKGTVETIANPAVEREVTGLILAKSGIGVAAKPGPEGEPDTASGTPAKARAAKNDKTATTRAAA